MSTQTTQKCRDQSTHLSGDTALNSVRFATLTCERNDAVSTNCPTVLANLSHHNTIPIPATKRKSNQSHIETVSTKNKIKGSRGDRRSPGEKGVEREARHEHTIRELGYARQDEEDEEGVDEF